MKPLAYSAVGLMISASTALAANVNYNDLATFQGDADALQNVDFDAGNDGAEILNFYSAQGVTFSPGNRFEGGFIQPVNNPNGWINDQAMFFDADFSAGFNMVGVHNVLNAGTSTLTAYGAGNVVLGTVTSDSVASTLDFFGIQTMSDILRIEVNVAGGGWGLDDLYFGSSEASIVPVPASLPLLLAGLGGLGLMARRRKTT